MATMVTTAPMFYNVCPSLIANLSIFINNAVKGVTSAVFELTQTDRNFFVHTEYSCSCEEMK